MIPVVAATTLALPACGSSSQPVLPATAQLPSASVSVATGPVPAAALDAKQVLDKLTAAGLPITHAATQDENSDPNNLLGRPGQYTSRASFDVPGGDSGAKPGSVDRGGVVEVFGAAADAKRRVDYIQGLLKGNPVLGTEYDYQAGPVLVRVTGKVKPSVAARFQQAVTKLGS